jgi:membrane protease YdiL (CAAX protease family)
MTWANYYPSKRHTIDWSHVLDFLVLSPLKEELIFRALVFHRLFNRVSSPIIACGIASLLFGLTHLANLKHTAFSTTYVMLQTFLGVEIGFFYNLHFLRSHSLLDCILLHVMNNIVSSFVSTKTASLSLQDPIVDGLCMKCFLCPLVSSKIT